MVWSRDRTWVFASPDMPIEWNNMNVRIALAIVCISLGAAQVVTAQETRATGPEARQRAPADVPASSETGDRDPAAETEPPAPGEALESFKPTEEIPADSAVTFPVDI